MTTVPHRQPAIIRYRAYGLVLSCTEPLQELAQTPALHTSDTPDLAIIFSPPDGPVPVPADWYLTISLADGTPWMRCAKISRGYLLSFPDLADFVFDISNPSIHCLPHGNIPSHTIHHLLLDQVLPLVLNYQGKEVLHGAAIATPYGACAFVGMTGTGKSTLAASFCSAGYSVLTDDCVVLETHQHNIIVVPAYPHLRLWDDAIAGVFGTTGSCAPVAHYTPKQRFTTALAATATAGSPVPLAGIYILGSTASDLPVSSSIVQISPIHERDALMTLLSLAFKLDILDQHRLTQELDFLRHLVTHIPVRRLTIPDSLATLADVRTAILQDLRR